jgi:transcriptional regulator with XRE-family HTH domain
MRTLNEHERQRHANIRREREQLGRIVASTLWMMRNDRDVKQSKLADLLGVGEDVISNIERRRTKVSFVDFILWARYLDMDLGDMFEWILDRVGEYYQPSVRTQRRRLSAKSPPQGDR